MADFDWSNYQKFTPKEAVFKNGMTKDAAIAALAVNDTRRLANSLSEICNDMAANYNDAIRDETAYILENEQRTVEDIKEEILKTQQRINVLQEKQKDGTITDVEELELQGLTTEIGLLQDELTNAIANEKEASLGLEEEAEKQKSIRETAESYSEETIGLGEKLIEKGNKIKKSWFKRIFHSAANNIKTGEKAVKSGTHLQATIDANDFMNKASKILSEATASVQDAEAAINSVDTTENPQKENSENTIDHKKEEEEK